MTPTPAPKGVEIEQFRAGFEAWFPTVHEAPAAMLFRRLSDNRRYEMLETEYAWIAYAHAKREASTEPNADLTACANCMRPKCEHNGKRCPPPYTTVWHAWDYETQAMPTYPEYASTEQSSTSTSQGAAPSIDGQLTDAPSPVKQEETLDEKAENALLWCHRRMKNSYGRLPFIEEAIAGLRARTAATRCRAEGGNTSNESGNSGAAPGDALDAARLDFLDGNAKFRMGWQVGIAPVGNLSVKSIIMGGKPIREAIDLAISAIAASTSKGEG